MNVVSTLVVSLLLVIAVILAIRSVHKDRKAGKFSCGGNCAGCCAGCHSCNAGTHHAK